MENFLYIHVHIIWRTLRNFLNIVTIVVTLVRFGSNLEMYIKVTRYLLEIYSSQKSPRYLNSQLFAILVSDDRFLFIYTNRYDYGTKICTIFSINCTFKITIRVIY